MKLKLKHLKAFLTASQISVTSCRDKRDIVELVVANRNRIVQNTFKTTNTQQQQQDSGSFNDTINSFVNNVQDFVNTTFSTGNSGGGGGGGEGRRNSTTPSTQTTQRRRSSTSNVNNANNPTTTTTMTTTTTNNNRGTGGGGDQSTTTSGMSNLNSIFNLISEQVPNVLQQTFANLPFNQAQPAPAPPPRNPPSPAPAPSTQQNANTAQSSSSSSNNPTTNTTTTTTEPTPAPPSQFVRRRASLSDLRSEEDIENLNIKQIKEILASNFVEYKGCCEKRELLEKVRRLYVSYQENKRLERELNENSTGSMTTTTAADANNMGPGVDAAKSAHNVDESDLCKICMESLVDCVLLECGHMVSCTKCGKRLAECPICRQNVVRVIRVFKS